MSRQCWSRTLVAAAVCFGLVTLAGCGPSGAPKTVKSTIKVHFDDENNTPLPMATSLVLVPEQGPDPKTSVAASNLTGGTDFELKTSYDNKELDGAPPGKYKVVVQAGAGAMEIETAKPTPECAKAETTPLRVEISDSGSVTPSPLKVPLAKQ